MTTEMMPTPEAEALLERVVLQNDLRQLTPADRVGYVRALCRSLGLNPLTQPFQYITLSGRLTLYATADCAEQLRKIHGVSVRVVSAGNEADLYIVRVEATDRTGRTDSDMAAVSIAGLKGEALANAFMKALTKAKRRVTMSICGLGLLEESETDTIPHAAKARVDMATGEVLDPPPPTPVAGGNGGKLAALTARLAAAAAAPPAESAPEVASPASPPPRAAEGGEMERSLLLSLIQQHRDKVNPVAWANLLRKHQLDITALGRTDVGVLQEFEQDLKAVVASTTRGRPLSHRPEPDERMR
jgi:hypothetical protein